MGTNSRPKLPPWSKFDWGELAKHTSRLDGEAHGAYLNLLRVYLSETGPFPDDLERILFLANMKTEKGQQDTKMVLRLMFYRDEQDGLLHNQFADWTLAKATESSERQSARAKMGLEGRSRDEKGRIKAGSQVGMAKGISNPPSHPAVAGDRPAVAGNDPAIKIEDSRKEIEDLKNKDNRKKKEEERTNIQDTKSTHFPEPSLGKDSGERHPAPPKGAGQVGADTLRPTSQDLPADGVEQAELEVEELQVRQENTRFGPKNRYAFRANGALYWVGFSNPRLQVGDRVQVQYRQGTFGPEVLKVTKQAINSQGVTAHL